MSRMKELVMNGFKHFNEVACALRNGDHPLVYVERGKILAYAVMWAMISVAASMIVGAAITDHDYLTKVVVITIVCSAGFSSIAMGIVLWFRINHYSEEWRKLIKEIRETFTQEDVDENLGVAYDEFRELVPEERRLQKAIPDEEDSSGYHEAVALHSNAKAAVQQAKDRFWRMHGFFKALGFEVRKKMGDYAASDEETKESDVQQ